MKLSRIIIISILALSISLNKSYSQEYREMLSDYWDSYYDRYPSGIEKAFQATDFINVIEHVNFIPKGSLMRNDQLLLKKVLLQLDFASLRQMMITGSFYSRTKKHDDYFQLYNLTYTKIEKNTWDRLCPYLIPLMSLDNTINIK